MSTSASNSRVKPESLPVHGGSTCRTAPSGQLHPRHAHLEEAFVLEEVQMSVSLGDRVVDGMLAGDTRHCEACAGSKVHLDRQRSRLRVEVSASNEPRRIDAQRGLKQLVGHGGSGSHNEGRLQSEASAEFPTASRAHVRGLRHARPAMESA
jgi:hypothetical protein